MEHGYYSQGSKCPNETVPNALWTVEIIHAGLELEILSVFEIGTRTCLDVSASSSLQYRDIEETLDRVSQKSGYPRMVYLRGDGRLFLALELWACAHGVDLRVDVAKHSIAERRLPRAFAVINKHYNLNDGSPQWLASMLMAIVNSKQAKPRWAIGRLRQGAQGE